MLQKPQDSGVAGGFLRKLRTDVPVLSALPSDAVNLYAVSTPPDRLVLVIEVAGQVIEIPRA